MMADKTVPKTKKALIIAGIAYLFLPFDLIPAMVFPLSLIDDPPSLRAALVPF